MMTVAEAIRGRQSIRAFLDTPVPRPLIERILKTAGRAPSGSNIQPWKAHVLQGEAKRRFERRYSRALRGRRRGPARVQLLSGQMA